MGLDNRPRRMGYLLTDYDHQFSLETGWPAALERRASLTQVATPRTPKPRLVRL